MIDRIEILLIGSVGLFELVLLLLLTQPINRSKVAVWLKWLVAGAFLYHFGYFSRLMLQSEQTESATHLDRVAMCLLSGGLLLMPCAMLHASLRLLSFKQGDNLRQPRSDWRYSLLYSPLLLLVAAAWFILHGSERNFIESIAPVKIFYLGWLFFANLLSALIFIRIAFKIDDPVAKRFFLAISSILILLTGGAILYAVVSIGTSWEPWCRISVGISPFIPAAVFVWFTLKSRMLPVVFEQSIVYGGIVLILLLLHRLIVTPIAISMREQFNVDFIIIEVLFVSSVIWCVRPLRRRVGESLRFLLSPNAFRIRDTLRKLALDVAQQTSRSIDERCEWFATELCERFELKWVQIAYHSEDSHSIILYRSGDSALALDSIDVDSVKTTESIRQLAHCANKVAKPIERGEEEDEKTANLMESLQCDVAFPMRYKSIDGAILFGSRRHFDRLADEQITSISVLVDQFSATLQNHRDEELRRLAERKGLQQEKLSTLGLISGSLAHELRNPLSSIRTIASLISEEMERENPNQHDLRLIVSEVDRLNQTLQRVLEFAKPSEVNNHAIEPDRIIARLLSIMDYYAKERSITLEVHLKAPLASIMASDAALNEIFMNLIKNAMEASVHRENATVRIESEALKEAYRVKVVDNGMGIAADRIESIFLPFETSKETGTGLGLYIVSERVRELTGTIRVESAIGLGSTFIVELPIRSRSAP